MEQWRCIRSCFFRSQLFEPGMELGGEENEIPRHFKSVIDGRVGTRDKIIPDSPKIPIEELMKDSPKELQDKAKTLWSMNKAELCAHGRFLGVEFNPDEMTRAEMIKQVVELKNKRGSTLQEQVDITKR
jgi:hypothetical protein